MPELRKCPLTDRWVIIAPDRAKRPLEYQTPTAAPRSLFDPFAEGNETATPPEILAFRDPTTAADASGWRVRVVPNKFPALGTMGDPERRGNGVYDAMDGIGAHEVIIEGPRTEANLSHLPVTTIREVLLAYRERLNALKRDRRLAHGLIFKNKGVMAGASLEHSHSQLIATSIVPITVREEMARALEFYRNHDRSLYEEILERELADSSRIVLESSAFLVFCPYAGRFPYETWILPKQQCGRYESIEPSDLDELGRVLKLMLGKLEHALDDPPYNYILYTAPFHAVASPHYRWRMEIIPRLTQVAGYEWGSGFFINPVPPEVAAARLRVSS